MAMWKKFLVVFSLSTTRKWSTQGGTFSDSINGMKEILWVQWDDGFSVDLMWCLCMIWIRCANAYRILWLTPSAIVLSRYSPNIEDLPHFETIPFVPNVLLSNFLPTFRGDLPFLEEVTKPTRSFEWHRTAWKTQILDQWIHDFADHYWLDAIALNRLLFLIPKKICVKSSY